MAIATSFDYKAKDIDAVEKCICPCFYVFEASENHKPHSLREYTLFFWPLKNNCNVDEKVFDTQPTKVSEVFDEHEGFRYYEKSFGYRFHESHCTEHSIQNLGRAAEITKGEIVCVAGQGSTALADWKEKTYEKPQGPSTWKLDLEEVKLRLAEVQESYGYHVSAGFGV